MIVVIDTNHLLRIAAAYQRSPLFAAWMNRRFILAVSEPLMAELALSFRARKHTVFCPKHVADG